MSFTAALILALAASASPAPAASAETMSATAKASVVILKPVMVRQDGGLQGENADTPVYQMIHNGETIRYEFQ